MRAQPDLQIKNEPERILFLSTIFVAFVGRVEGEFAVAKSLLDCQLEPEARHLVCHNDTGAD